MAKNSNKDKTKNPILAEIESAPEVPATPPEPKVEDLLAKEELTAEDMDVLSAHKDDLTDEQKVKVGLIEPETVEEVAEPAPQPPKPPKAPIIEPEPPKPEVVPELPATQPEETQEQKDQRYKAQQSEAQILAARNAEFINKVDEASKIAEPTEDELKTYVRTDGVDWDELTNSEKAQWKRTFVSEKKFAVINEAVQATRKIDEWAGNVDKYLDNIEGKSELLPLSGHESDFRKFCMQPTHRGVDLAILKDAFISRIPPTEPKRGSLFLKGGGGEREVVKDGMEDADQVAKLRVNDPKEYARQLRAGKIKIEV